MKHTIQILCDDNRSKFHKPHHLNTLPIPKSKLTRKYPPKIPHIPTTQIQIRPKLTISIISGKFWILDNFLQITKKTIHTMLNPIIIIITWTKTTIIIIIEKYIPIKIILHKNILHIWHNREKSIFQHHLRSFKISSERSSYFQYTQKLFNIIWQNI
ncbi:MAG: hypothetical protein Harvfovirus69_5 [Harvfovirus sp.]|uniref:Uncharacterized protein n=1 Tax=Harvfovirus sp. TaxID=2487768 RepID=A0A3G5A7P6_9VIRU|nr:MAG: hypothetical protein Harvfovirus69_5 [Harvfovirus sp.]